MKLEKKEIAGVTAHFRPGTSDEKVLTEVLEKKTYRKTGIGFDVEPDELWLDLGANIGAFALYCASKGARAECYEPDADCFAVLSKNVPRFKRVREAVTGWKTATVDFFVSPKDTDHSRGTTIKYNKAKDAGHVPNFYAGRLRASSFSGVKLDIEGSEGLLLDNWLLPKCDKLVMEYHSSRDTSVKNFARRLLLLLLQAHFANVSYPPEFDRILASKAEKFERWIDVPGHPKGGRFVQHPMADRLIFAWGRK